MTSRRIAKNSGLRHTALAAFAATALLGAQAAWAHTDPVGNTDTGIGASMRAFRADGVTPVGDGSVTRCEMIVYQATVRPQAGAVAFEQGSWSITTPDGVAHDVTPVGGIPCVGGTVDDAAMPGGRGNCAPTIDHVDSALVMYTVNPANINAFGQITARTDYINGFSHKGTNDTFGANAGIAFPIDVGPDCSDGLACNGIETCDSNVKFEIVDATHFRKGTCVPGTPVVCGQCTKCSEPSGTCVGDAAQVGQPCTGPAAVECQSPVCQANGTCANAADATKNSTPCGTDTAGDCKHPGCENGSCAPAHTFDQAGTSCTTVTPGQCKKAECDGAGTCQQSPDAGQVGQPCTGPAAEECKSPVCQANGTCANQADSTKNSTPCGTDTPGDCVHPGCENGVCAPAHTTDQNDTPCTSAGPDTPGDCKHPCCEAGACVADAAGCRDQDSTPCTDSDNPNCQAGCEAGSCVQDHVCQNLICRTPGFWGTHAGTEKTCSQNITQAVLSAGGGATICGEHITTTNLNDAASSTEAICVKVRGDQRIQLARQLTSMALNCIVSGGDSDCTGTTSGLINLFSDCNLACTGGASSRSVGECISEVDCFNNGGDFDSNSGTCMDGGVNNCHNQALPLENFDLPNNNPSSGKCFGQQGPAGSSGRCSDARANNCNVIGANEANCGSDSNP